MYSITRKLLTPTAFLVMAVAILATSPVRAHMEMCQPPPRGSKFSPDKSNIDYNNKSPTQAICQGKPAGAIVGTYKAGGSVDVAFDGSAVHNGGHCQFSLSYDGGKTFVVIKDVMNDCLVGAKNYNIPLPATAPASKNAIFAWSWINASGNREYYMNCADVAIEGPADGKVSGPKMLVANILGGPTVPEWGGGVDKVGAGLFAQRPTISVTANGASTGGSYGKPSAYPSNPPAYPSSPSAPSTPEPSKPAYPSNSTAPSDAAPSTPAYPAKPATPSAPEPAPSSSPAPSNGSGYPTTQPPASTPPPASYPSPSAPSAPLPAAGCKSDKLLCVDSTHFTTCAPSGPVKMSCAPGTVCIPNGSDNMTCGYPTNVEPTKPKSSYY